MWYIILLWVLFGVSHSVLASNRVKQAVHRGGSVFHRYYRIAYNLFSALFLLLILYFTLTLDAGNRLLPEQIAVSIGGYSLMLAGVAVLVAAFAAFDWKEFLGISYLKETVQPASALVTTGLYGYVRHPLYFGIILLTAGYFLVQPTAVVGASAITIFIYLIVGSRLEEKKLTEHFGTSYIEYSKRVKMLIPFVF